MEKTQHIKVIKTADGSCTLYNEAIDETYHSAKGAITESRHVFIEAGLNFSLAQKDRCAVLEVGFGTGLNAILAVEQALHHTDKQIHYVGLEPYPLPFHLIDDLDYKSILPTELHPYFDKLHQAEWNKLVRLLPNFTFYKTTDTLESFFDVANYDVVFFDAFAPKKQPEMWELAHFIKLYNILNSGGVLTSYCVMGEVRRNLSEAGFTIEKLAGPPNGKREMLRASKN
jgi:tRNA U34 5-methylaminomethyl-2-thiouridine-forming methyltransferase MnmC